MTGQIYKENVFFVEEVKHRLRHILNDDFKPNSLSNPTEDGIVIDNGKQAMITKPKEMALTEYLNSFPVSDEHFSDRQLFDALTTFGDNDQRYLTALNAIRAVHNESKYKVEQDIVLEVEPVSLEQNHNTHFDLGIFGVEDHSIDKVKLNKLMRHFAVKVDSDDFYLLIDQEGNVVETESNETLRLFEDEVKGHIHE